MPSILGSVGVYFESYDSTELHRVVKESWVLARGIQTNPTCNIIRLQQDGKVPHVVYFTGSTTNLDAGTGTNIACLVSDYTVEEVTTSAGVIKTGDRKITIYDFEVLLKHLIEFPASSGKYWNVVNTEYKSFSGRSVSQIRLRQG